MAKGWKMTSEQKQRLSEAHKGPRPWRKGKKHTPESILKMSLAHKGKPAWNKGKPFSEETRRKISEGHKGQIAWNKGKKLGFVPKGAFKKGKVSWIKGKHHSEESKRKISEGHKGMIPWNKGKHHSEESNEKNRLAHLGKEGFWTGKHRSEETKIKLSEATKKVWNNPEKKKRMIEAYNKAMSNPEERKRRSERSTATLLRLYESGTFPRQANTKPERQIKEELIKRGYKEGTDFIHQYRFMNKFMCDFCFPQQKVVVEAYGDFWHANPKKYPVGSVLHSHQIKGMGRDKSKKAYIEKVDHHSWVYLIIWESDIKQDVAKCVDRIEEVLAEKKKI